MILNSMTPLRILCIMLALPLFVGLCDLGANEHKVWKNEFCKGLTKLSSGKSGKNYNKAAESEMLSLASSMDIDAAMSALLELWNRGYPNIEFYWWKHEDRAIRSFVLSLYLCSTTEDVSWVPDFTNYINLFNAKKSKERREEIEFVYSYRSSIAGLIANSLKIVDIDRYNSRFKFYFGNVEKAKIGKPLPK